MSEPSAVARVGAVAIWQADGAFMFAAGLAVDADGAPDCYHPRTLAHPLSGSPPGLDDLRNAGRTGNWWGVATDTGRADGKPVVQGAGDPCPGFYVSTTALVDPARGERDPARYVNSSLVPFVSLPARPFRGALAPGDLGVVFYKKLRCPVIYADVGPDDEIGEGSIALSKALGLYAGTPKLGHDKRDVVYLMFPGTRASPRWPRALDDIAASALGRLASWGGPARVEAMYPYLVGALT